MREQIEDAQELITDLYALLSLKDEEIAELRVRVQFLTGELSKIKADCTYEVA